MKKTLLFLGLIAVSQSIFSQDLLITTKGDSLNCRITKNTSKIISYRFMQDGVVKDTTLSKESVKEFMYDVYAVNEDLKVVADKNNHSRYRYRLALNYGLSSMLAPLSDDYSEIFDQYFTDLKSGSLLSGDISYYLSETVGVGIKYSQFKTSNKIDRIYERDLQNVIVRTGSMSDDITVSYVGPTVSTRLQGLGNNNAFLLSLSMGYLGYTNNQVVFDAYKLKGNTMGFSIDLGYDFGITKNLALGVQFSYCYGRLSEYEKTSNLGTETIKLKKDKYENLDRLDFTVGLRFMD